MPLPGYDVDPEWTVGEYACYFIELSVSGRIFWSQDVYFDRSKYGRISKAQEQYRKSFGSKLGRAWVRCLSRKLTPFSSNC